MVAMAVLPIDDQQFRRLTDTALEALAKSLLVAEEGAGFEVEQQQGVLNVLFEDPAAKFVITPNSPVRQIWISALSTSFKLDWSQERNEFVLRKTGEGLKELVSRLVNTQLGEESVKL